MYVMRDLSARAKFPFGRFQSPLLIMSKIVAKIQLVCQKIGGGGEFSELFFSFQFRQWLKVLEATFRNKTRLAYV